MAGTLSLAIPGSGARAQVAESLRFEIRDFRVAGATLLSRTAIEQVLAPYTGPNREFADIDRALQALRAAYARLGYRGVVVRLQEQELDGGIVRIDATETTIESVDTRGLQYFAGDWLTKSLPMLEPGLAIDFDNLGRALDVINENPAIKVAVEIQPGTQDEQQRVRIVGADADPLTRFLSFDDTGNAATGRHRVAIGMRHADIGGRADMLTMQYAVSAEKPAAASFWGLGYRLPLPAQGLAADAYLGHSDVSSGTVAGLFDVAGKGTVAGLRLTRALDRIGSYRHQIAAALDYRDFRNRVTVNGGASLVPDYVVHPFSLSYSGELDSTSVTVTAVQGFAGGPRSDTATLSQARLGANAGYSLWRFGASHGEALPGGWLVRALASAQETSAALVPGEQFGLGGAQSVRGFEERHIAGDRGIRLSMEIHAPSQPLERFELRPLAFVDYGALRRNQVQPGEVAHEGIASWGFGLRLQLQKQVALALDVARVERGTATQPVGRERMHLGLQFYF